MVVVVVVVVVAGVAELNAIVVVVVLLSCIVRGMPVRVAWVSVSVSVRLCECISAGGGS